MDVSLCKHVDIGVSALGRSVWTLMSTSLANVFFEILENDSSPHLPPSLRPPRRRHRQSPPGSSTPPAVGVCLRGIFLGGGGKEGGRRGEERGRAWGNKLSDVFYFYKQRWVEGVGDA